MDYDCIGICQPDPESGLCEGCGRPYFDSVEPQPTVDNTAATPTPDITSASGATCSSS